MYKNQNLKKGQIQYQNGNNRRNNEFEDKAIEILRKYIEKA